MDDKLDIDIYEGLDEDLDKNISETTPTSFEKTITDLEEPIDCLPYSNLTDIVIIEEKYNNSINKNNELQKALQEMKKRLYLLHTENKVLKANISSLYKTAKCEIDRKNTQISELRNELDEMIFRRHRMEADKLK